MIDHVTHIKKKQSKNGMEMQEDEAMLEADSPIKDDMSETNKDMENSSPEKGDESTDVDEEKKGGCLIGFRALDEIRNVVKSYMSRLAVYEDTVNIFKFIVPKALAKTPQLVLSRVNSSLMQKESNNYYSYLKLMSV